MTAAPAATSPSAAPQDEPLAAIPKSATWARVEQWTLAIFIVVPFAALVAAIPVAWGWGLHWRDIVIAFVFYAISGHGITVGFHRFFTHGAFKANRGLKIALAISGTLALEGPIVRWVADHRRHHAYSDKEGDPHSPWMYGGGFTGTVRGFWHAHMGWLFDPEQTNQQRFAPDLLADPDIRAINKYFGLFTAFTLLAPALVGGLWSWSWQGALSAFFWAGIVRVGLLHHITWSVNSVCHMVGKQPFRSRDQSRNVWWLSVPSMGESWHNLHHADPTCARHGVDRGQLDTSARVIWVFEKLGWATDVRWPQPTRIDAKRAPSSRV